MINHYKIENLEKLLTVNNSLSNTDFSKILSNKNLKLSSNSRIAQLNSLNKILQIMTGNIKLFIIA